jgi:hypothetical protein
MLAVELVVALAPDDDADALPIGLLAIGVGLEHRNLGDSLADQRVSAGQGKVVEVRHPCAQLLLCTNKQQRAIGD